MEIKLDAAQQAWSGINHRQTDDLGFKRVPALDKCFAILDFIAASKRPLGVSEISRRLELNKSTVFNILRTLVDLEVLELRPGSKVVFGTRLYLLGKSTAGRPDLVSIVRPHLEEISRESVCSAFLVVREGASAIIVDKVEAAANVRASYEIGVRLPLLGGAEGKALLCRLSDRELDAIFREHEPRRLARHSRIDRAGLRKALAEVRKAGIALDKAKHIEGIVALAVPIKTNRAALQAAILAVGLRGHSWDGDIFSLSKLLKSAARDVGLRLSTV